LKFFFRSLLHNIGSAFAVRAPIGTTVGRVDGQVPVRLPRRTSDGARPGDHAPVRVRRTGRPTSGLRDAADAVTPTHGPRQVRDFPAADRHRRHSRIGRRPVAGEYLSVFDNIINFFFIYITQL